MKRSALVAAMVSCVVGVTVVSAQLGDVAKKEAERRKTVTPGKSYTNENVKPDPTTPAAPPSTGATETPRETPSEPAPGASSTPASDTPPPVSSDPVQRKVEEAQWREKMKTAREALERAKSFADALQSKLNALNTDFVNRDDPVQRAKIAQDRDKALADMDRAKKEIEQHTKAIAKIQDDARRSGAPAGWVR